MGPSDGTSVLRSGGSLRGGRLIVGATSLMDPSGSNRSTGFLPSPSVNDATKAAVNGSA